MRTMVCALGIALFIAPPLTAQDSAGPPDSVARQRLQREIERRFGQVVQQQLGLTADQAARLRATEERFRPRRQAVIRRQVLLRGALQGQMRPGEAADADSVRKLMDGLQASRAELLRLDEQQEREMSAYLTPVQRARYQMLRERLMRRLQEVRRERVTQPGRGGRRPGRQPRGPRG
jgi:Spy/CpxP family protein refolding chaperone